MAKVKLLSEVYSIDRNEGRRLGGFAVQAIAKSCMLCENMGERGGEKRVELLQGVFFVAPICVQYCD